MSLRFNTMTVSLPKEIRVEPGLIPEILRRNRVLFLRMAKGEHKIGKINKEGG